MAQIKIAKSTIDTLSREFLSKIGVHHENETGVKLTDEERGMVEKEVMKTIKGWIRTMEEQVYYNYEYNVNKVIQKRK